jgi:lipopolysaccharide export system protein LptA
VRLTIERIRTLVLAAGVLLVAAIVVFLVIGKWKNPLNRRDIPGRLGIDIQQEANGVTYTQSHGGRTIFRIHASRVVQLRNDRATLHDVVIELYGQNGSGADRIEGDEFEYDQKTGTATAAGPVEITLMRPPQKPAGQEAGRRRPDGRTSPESSLENAVHVKTSGLVFNQQSGIASTDQRVEFSTAQGSGSATGASYNSGRGYLTLDRDVELTTERGGSPVRIRALHAEFDRDAQICYMHEAAAQTPTERATAVDAQIVFRDDGSVESVNAAKGFTVSTNAGSRLAAPAAAMEFGENSQPRRGHMTGGVTMDSVANGRTVHGTSPEMELEFDARGELRRAHLQRGVAFESHQQGQVTAGGQLIPTETARTWRSPVADIDFRTVKPGQIEPAALHGAGGVVLTGQTRRGNALPESSRLSADEVSGQFGPNSTLSSMSGLGHAAIEQTTAAGARQTATGDRLDVRFAPAGQPGNNANASAEAAQIQSAVLDGHVTLRQQPAAKSGSQQASQALTATAGHAVYENAGEWLHLTVNPRVDDGGMELTADRVDASQASGDAFAHGDVKATWIGAAPAGRQSAAADIGGGDIALGGQGPAHAIAAEAQLHQPTGEVIFRGHARLWQDANSVAAPVIAIDRQKQTLTARTTTPADPVLAVVLSAGAPGAESRPAPPGEGQPAHSPSVIRVRGGGLWYSGVERKAIMRAAPLASVTAATGAFQSVSDELDLFLAPAAANSPASAGTGQIDRMTAIGNVVVLSQGRRGAGAQLAYSSRTGDYVLTGTPSAPPQMTDPQRGSVTGQALIFHTRDDSVSIEGGNRQTTTQTTAPR